MHIKRTLGLAIVACALFCLPFFFFYFRDNFSTHYPIKALSSEILRSGSIPYWNFYAGGGQPLAGNPNTLTFYPTTLLYLFLPPLVAFNLHFLIHIGAGFAGLRALAMAQGTSDRSATLAAASYVLGGAAISTLCFYNLVCSIALLPAAVLALERLIVERSLRRGFVLGGVCGLIGLAGEPVTVLGAALLLLIVAAGRLQLRHGLSLAVAIVVAILVTMPQMIAYSEIAGEVERAFKAYSVETVFAASLRPHRLLEIVIGPYLGLVTDVGPHAYRSNPAAGYWPLFLPTVLGGPLLLVAVVQRLPRPALRLKIAAAIFLFLALGRFNPIVAGVVERMELLRFLRYPEKFALPFAVAAALVLALWLDRLPERRALSIAAVVLVLSVVAAAATLGRVAEGSHLRLAVGAAVSLTTLLAGWYPDRRPMIALHFALLLYWGVRTIPIDYARDYVRTPEIVRAVPGPVHVVVSERPWIRGSSARAQFRAGAQMLDPISGVTHGIAYGMNPSPEGMYSWLSAIVTERADRVAPVLKLRYFWMRGVRTIVSSGANGPSVARLPGAAPLIQPVSRMTQAASVQEAVARIEGPGFDPASETIVPRSADSIPAGDVRILSVGSGPQELSFSTSASRASAVVVNQSYFSGWQARASGRPVRIFPANIDRLGIVVPAGEHQVTLQFGRRRAAVASSWFVSFALLAAAAIASRTPMAVPAR